MRNTCSSRLLRPFSREMLLRACSPSGRSRLGSPAKKGSIGTAHTRAAHFTATRSRFEQRSEAAQPLLRASGAPSNRGTSAERQTEAAPEPPGAAAACAAAGVPAGQPCRAPQPAAAGARTRPRHPRRRRPGSCSCRSWGAFSDSLSQLPMHARSRTARRRRLRWGSSPDPVMAASRRVCCRGSAAARAARVRTPGHALSISADGAALGRARLPRAGGVLGRQPQGGRARAADERARAGRRRAPTDMHCLRLGV